LRGGIAEAYRPQVDEVVETADDPVVDETDGRDPADLDAREAARIRRRDRDADAAARDLMRPGMGKVFKQILDSQASAAREPPKRKRKRSRA
jgi:hypothetical protein